MSVLLCVSPCCALPGIHTDGCDDGDCRGCQPARAADGLYLCQRCTAQLGRDALRAAQLHAALGLVLAGGSTGERGPGGRSAGLDLNDVALEARTAIATVLGTLCRLIAEERGLALPADPMLARAEFVARHGEWLAAHPAADEHARDLRDVATDGRSWRVAYAVSGDRTLIGVCNQPRTDASGDPGAVCGTALFHRDGEETLVCPGCGTEGTVPWWRWEMCAGAEGEGIVDAYAGAAYLSWRWGRLVDPGLVRKWGQRHGLALRGVDDVLLRDHQQRVLFVLGELEAHAVKTWGAPDDALAKVSA